MSTLASPPLTDLRPRLRADIVFGPAERKAGRTIYHAKDSFTKQFFRLGEREHFLFSCMDGRRTVPEIETAYRSRFGKRLDGSAWAQIFSLAAQKNLLEGQTSVSELEELRQAVAKKGKTGGLLALRWPLLQPEPMLRFLMPGFRFVARPFFVGTGLASILVIQCWIALRWSLFQTEMGTLRHAHWPWFWWVFGAFLMAAAICHEIAHGLTCKYFGGEVPEMGIVFRYLLFFPYCRIDDVVLFEKRAARMWTACAGAFVSLLLLVPFYFVWAAARPGTPAKAFCAALFTIYNGLCLLNLVPFVQLDGYYALSYLLRCPDLRADSYQYLKVSLQRVAGNATRAFACTPREVAIYLSYGLTSAVVTAFLLLSAVRHWINYFVGWFGPFWGLAAMVLLTLSVFSAKQIQTAVGRLR